MVKLKHTFLAGAVVMLVSCVAPKAVVVAQPSVKPKKEEKTPEPVIAEVELPATPDDGLRMPSNMLELPGEGEFRATSPAVAKPTDAGAVISRPPTDPPSRTKPKDDGVGGQR